MAPLPSPSDPDVGGQLHAELQLQAFDESRPPLWRRVRWQEVLRDLILALAAWTGGVAFQAGFWALWSWVLIITVALIIITNPTLANHRAARRALRAATQ